MKLGEALAIGLVLGVAATPAGADDLPPEPDRVAEDEVDVGPVAGTVFARADDLAALPAQTFATNYAVESGKNFGAGAEPAGIQHRLQASYGVTDWLKLSVDLHAKHRLDTKELKVGVFAPELRLTLGGMLDAVDRWPLDVSAYVGPRIRIMGRRDPAVVLGFGTNTPRGPLHFTVNTGVEITVPDPDEGTDRSFGPRYDLGVGHELGSGFVATVEVWGHAAWSRGGYVEQEHHAGPALLFVYDIARFGLGGAGGWRGQPRGEQAEVRGMLTAGLEIGGRP